MTLSTEQSEKLRDTLLAAGASNEWIIHYWSILSEGVEAICEAREKAAFRRGAASVNQSSPIRHASTPGGGFDPVSFTTGMIIGGMS